MISTAGRQAKRLITNQSAAVINKCSAFSSTSSFVSPSTLFFHSTIRFYSDKREDEKNKEASSENALTHLKTKQRLINSFAELFPTFVDKVEPIPCKEAILLKNFESYLNKNNPIQIERGCILKVMHLIDNFNNRKSIFDDPLLIDLLTGKKEALVALTLVVDDELRSFIKSHLCGQEFLNHDEKRRIPTDKKFVTKIVGHTLLTDIYISAYKLENHFRETNQPVYTMVNWGRNEHEYGYQLHAIIVFGINKLDNIVFWDVSDKLPDGIPRIREMNIEEFNERRSLSPTMVGPIRGNAIRSPIYYYNKE